MCILTQCVNLSFSTINTGYQEGTHFHKFQFENFTEPTDKGNRKGKQLFCHIFKGIRLIRVSSYVTLFH
jgi:hypothetical protein